MNSFFSKPYFSFSKVIFVINVSSLLLIFSCKNANKPSYSNDAFILYNINIIDVENGAIKKDKAILIDKGLIKRIGNFKDVKSLVPKNKQYNLNHKFIIPGLWDMHVHLSIIGKESLPLFVLNGVTGVRDMGGDWTKLKEWRALGNKINQSVLPKIKTAGPILESPEFHEWLKQNLGLSYAKNRMPVNSPERAHSIVDSLSEDGVDFIKVRTVKSQEIFQAISEACKENDMSLTGHIDQNLGFEFAINNNLSSIEHDLFFQIFDMKEKAISNILQSIMNSNVYFTPTLLATNNYRLKPKSGLKQLAADTLNQTLEYRKFLSPTLIEEWNIQLEMQVLESPMKWDSLIVRSRFFAKSLASKTTVLSGTDCGIVGIIPGRGLHEELILLVDNMGLSNFQALQASTINAVRSLGLQDEYGKVKPNYKADLLILNGNPLKDIAYTSDIFSVVKNGIMINQNEIKLRLNKISNDVRKNNLHYKPETLNYLMTILSERNSSSN